MNRPISVAEIAECIHPCTSLWKSVAVLKGFFDDTGTHSGHRIMGFGGFVGTVQAWSEIEPQWAQIIAEIGNVYPAVKSLHMSVAMMQRDEFENIEKPIIRYMVTQLAQIMGAQRLTPFFSAVDPNAWNTVATDPKFRLRFPDPICLCFEDLVQSLAKWSKGSAGGEFISPMFAIDQKTDRFAQIGNLYTAHPSYRTVLGTLAFDYADRVVGLQAADFLAHQMGWDIQNNASTVQFRTATGDSAVIGHYFDAIGLKVVQHRYRESGYSSGVVDLFSPLPPPSKP